MADKVYLDDNGNPVKSEKVYLDDNGEPVGATPTAPKSGGVRDTITRFGKTVASDVGGLAQGLAQMAASGLNAGTMAQETGRALTSRYLETGKPVVSLADLTELATGAPLRQMKQEWTEGKYPEMAGHTAVALGTMLAPKGIRAGREAMLARSTPPVVTPKPTLRPKPTQPPIEQVMADVIADIRKPPQSVTLPPGLPQQPVTFPDVPRARPTLKRAVKAEPAPPVATGTGTPTSAAHVPTQPPGQIRMNVSAPRAAKPTPELPEAWKALVKAQEPAQAPAGGAIDIQAQPGMGLDPNVVTKHREGLGDLGAARRAVGSEKAATNLDAVASELGVDRSVLQQMIRDTTDGPSRRPMAAELAEMDNDYLRRISDERGAINPRLAMTLGATAAGGVGGAALAEDTNPVAGGLIGALTGLAAANPAKALKAIQVARVTAMLSGAAVPKSMAGNAGSILTAAAERGSMAPIKEAARLPTNLKNLAQGWRKGANPAGIGHIGRVNVFGRAMGAMDEATTKALQRSGLSLEEAQRLLLTAPEALVGRGLQTRLQGPWGRQMFPFQRTPFNSVGEGIASLDDLLPKSGASAVKRGLTYGAGATGAAAGSETDNPLALALMAAFFGPRALPFAIGAALTAGPQVAQRVGVGLPEGSIRDIVDPLRPLDKPALLKLLESGGR